MHTVGGMVALTGAIALGPRLGRKFKRDGGGLPPGHDMTIAAVGGVILWFGWYGFNPGSHPVGAWTSRASAGSPPTRRWPPVPAACQRCSSCTRRIKKWDTGITVNGFLGGLVAITAPATG